jgi:hypothetical protein
MIYLKLLGWILIGVAPWVLIDWYQIMKLKRTPNHLVEFILRCMAGIVYGALAFNVQMGMDGVWVIMFEATSFYLFFEIALNLARSLAWDYIGRTSAIDRFLYNRRSLYYLLKLASAAGMVISIIKLL